MKRGIVIFFVLFILIFISSVYAKNSTKSADISLNLDWNSQDIVNGGEFNMQVSAEGLDQKNYDAKVFISDESGKIISQTYDGNKWITSNNYVKNFFIESESKEGEIKLRIKKESDDFEGDAKIGLRVRENGKTSYNEIEKDIFVIGSLKNTSNNEDMSNSVIDASEEPSPVKEEIQKETIDNNLNNSVGKNIKQDNLNSLISGEAINLGKSNKNQMNQNQTEDIKSQNDTVYESKNESIKKYALYAFLGLCMVFIILLILKKV